MSFMETVYKKALKPVLFRFDPESVHNVFVSVGEKFGNSRAGQRLIDSMYGYDGPDISKTVDGIPYKTPLILAAGFDYNGRLTNILGSVGFGGVEIGSVTAYSSEGNEPPRLRRAVESKSLIVYKGLKNEGVDRVIERLRERGVQEGLVLGISIAMTNAESSSTLEGAVDDYFTSFKKLNEEGLGDYYTINISCPNVYGGESFTDPERLEVLLARLADVDCQVPRYAKMPINIDWEQFRQLVDILRTFEFDGVIIGNLQKDYDKLDVRQEGPDEYRGGLSGRPCREESTKLIRKTRQYCGPDFTIMGCGGVMSVEDANEKLDAGADLIQLISGMIFEGPHLMSDIAEAIAEDGEDDAR